MPQSRKRQGHHYQKPADVPARQKARATVFWAIIFGIFGLMIAFFAAGAQYLALAGGVIGGAVIGYIVGKKMEAEAQK